MVSIANAKQAVVIERCIEEVEKSRKKLEAYIHAGAQGGGTMTLAYTADGERKELTLTLASKNNVLDRPSFDLVHEMLDFVKKKEESLRDEMRELGVEPNA